MAAPAPEAAEALQAARLAAPMRADAATAGTRPSRRHLLDQGNAFGRVRGARDPFPQSGKIGGGQLYRQQHGEQFVERRAAHRHSS
jgi:hypothetical protein